MLELRRANREDLDEIVALEQACFPPEQAADRASFSQRLAVFPDHFLLLCSDCGACVGMINGAVIRERYILDEMYADAGYHCADGAFQAVYGLDVLPEYRHQGFAHRLMAAMVELARNEGRRGVTLTCRPEKIGFYESMGFQEEGVADSDHGHVVWHNMVLEF